MEATAVVLLALLDCLFVSSSRLSHSSSEVSEVGFVRSRGKMEKKSFPESGLPVARPKEENTEEWSSADAAQYHPEVAGGIAVPAVVDRHLVARLPKFSRSTPLEPYLAQFRIAARH
ncbi:unnamed protein product [Boreogadus saida]